ncbi:MAG: aminotransferase class V-fold PLP-dependent enzyme [Bacteroidia bacterium]|nr:aminotransferase class V-fold PLP-dependent enzyme [Bacteroidia bacterium]
MNWEQIRDDFPVARNTVYFQSAGMSPLPNQVLDAIIKAYTKLNQYGDIHFMEDLIETERLRGVLASMLNTEADNVNIVPSNSYAMSLLALSFIDTVKTQFNIVSMFDEFPSNTVPYEYKGITMKYVNPINSRFNIDDIMSAVDENTLAVVTSYVQFGTGFRQDLKKLGQLLKQKNILFVVNATQGFPLFNVNVKEFNIDVMTCSIHKWGFIGHTGTIFYTSPEFRERFASPIAGWLSVDTGMELIHAGKNEPFSLHSSSRKYYTGTYNLQTLIGLKASMAYLNNIGFDNIVSRLFELGDYLIKKLNQVEIKIVSPVDSIQERSAIISITMGAELNSKAVFFLESKNVYTSLRGGVIRIAFNIFNNFEDIDKLIEALTEFKKTK